MPQGTRTNGGTVLRTPRFDWSGFYLVARLPPSPLGGPMDAELTAVPFVAVGNPEAHHPGGGLKCGMPRLSQWSIVRAQTSKRRAISRLPTQAPPGASLGCLGSRGRAVRVERHSWLSVIGIRRVSSKLTGRTVGVGLPRAVSGGRWQSSAIANQGPSKTPTKDGGGGGN